MKKIVVVTLLLVGLGVITFVTLRNRQIEPVLRLVSESEKTPPGFWEGIAHFTVLYDGSVKIAKVNSVDISPSGDYAIYTDDNARMMLYKHGTFLPRNVTPDKLGLIDKYSWDETNSRLVITYLQDVQDPQYANCPPTIIDLK